MTVLYALYLVWRLVVSFFVILFDTIRMQITWNRMVSKAIKERKKDE